jgi:ketosteroid isomerase-like protein
MSMTRRKFGIMAAGIAVAVSNGRTRASAAIDDTVREKVKNVLNAWETAWNASDMDAMWRLATDDVHWVNVVGMHWRGKAEVQKAHQAYFDLMFKDRTAKLDEIESVEALPGAQW